MYRCIRILCASLFLFCGLGLKVFAAGFPVAWGTSSFDMTNPPASISNAVAIAAGQYHNLAVLENRTVAGWGDNTSGKATAPATLAGVVVVAGGANHSLALRQNGRVVAWGDGTATNVPAGLTDAMRIAAGAFHSLALRSNGTVVAWGANNQGQASPPLGLSAVAAIAAGAQHSLALRSDGSVVAWGQNSFGQSGVPLNLSGVIAIAAGDTFSMALRNNGTIATWGNIAAPPAHSGVVAIAAGGGHGIALRNDRTVFCWGDNSLNQSVVPAGTSNIIAIAGGATHSVALRMAPPRIVAHPTPRSVLRGQSTTFNATFTGSTPLSLRWRQNGIVIPNATNASYTISSAQSGDAGNYSLLVSNAVGVTISTNALLTVNVPAGITQDPESQQIAVGGNATFNVGVEGTGQIRYRWQKSGTNIPLATNATYTISPVNTTHAGNYRVVVSNSFGAATSMVATLTVLQIPVINVEPQNQSVLAGTTAAFSVAATNALGYQWRKGNANITGANEAIYLVSNAQTNDAGRYRVVVTNQYGAVTSAVASLTVNLLPPGESMVVQWGEDPVFNGVEQVDIKVPDGLTDVGGIAAGAYHNLVLFRSGLVFGWGDNRFGQASSPAVLTNAMRISAGMHHSVALTSNGTVFAWGLNSLKQTDTPAGLTGVVAIAAGGNHTLALRSNGIVSAWGHTNYGQSVVPANATNVMTIAAGFEHSLAVLSNGTLRTWGNNDFGQRIPPFALSNLVAVAAGKYHSVGLRSDGKVFAWGQNTFGQTNVPAEAVDVIAICAGDNHSMALRRDGGLVCWGQDNFLQLHPPDGLATIVGIAAAGNRSLVRMTKRLRLAVPELLVNGNLRLRIRNDDGSSIDTGRVGRVEVYAANNPALPLSEWTKRNVVFSLASGALQGEDVAPLPNLRFYRAVEKP
jgi:alpha-tubulin suppressor-like RCC1 family protein